MIRLFSKVPLLGFSLSLVLSSIVAYAQLNAGGVTNIIKIEDGPDGSSAYRIFYKSIGLNGNLIDVSGLAIIPSGEPPVSGRPIVAWAHPTSGVVSRCAPSLAGLRFQTIQGLRNMIQRGFVVVATDYPGLGTPEVHPYLIGVSEARAVLDSVRAVRTLPNANTGAKFAVWGHSQGGHASLFTGIIAEQYAPELQLLGVAAAAPATDLLALLAADLNSPAGRNLTSMTLWSWSRLFNLSLNGIVDPQAMPSLNLLAQECIESPLDMVERNITVRPFAQHFLIEPQFYKTQPWARLMAENSQGPVPSKLPVFLAQGMDDQIVRPEITETYFQRLCRNGNAVTTKNLPGVGHGTIAMRTALDAVEWMAARFNGEAPINSCSTR